MAGTIILSKFAAAASAPMLWYLTVVMFISGVFLFVIVIFFRQLRGRPLPLLLYGFVSGSLMATYSAVGYITVEQVGASYISLTLAFPVLLTYVLAVILRMDRLHPLKLIAVVAGLSGGLLLALGKFEMPTAGGQGWVILASINPLFMAVGTIYRSSYWPKGSSSLLLASLLLLFGAAVTAPVAAFFEGTESIWRLFSNQELQIYCALAICFFSVQYVVFLALQRTSGPVFLSQIGPVAAAIGAVSAFSFLDEPAPPNLFLSAMLMIIGLGAFLLSRHRCDNI